MNTRSFSNVREALDALQLGTPQVLVSDIRMPGESGLELLHMVKQRYPSLPVIVMTAFSSTDTALEAMRNGTFSPGEPDAFKPLADSLTHHDEYMLMADYASYIGWAALERHIVEKLIGAQLGHVLGYVEKLKELDVSGIEPTAHAVPIIPPQSCSTRVIFSGNFACLMSASRSATRRSKVN